MPPKLILVGAALNGLCAVILGAFAAHALKSSLDTGALQTFKTAVNYQMYHALALLVLAGLSAHLGRQKWLSYSAWAFLLGIFLFSGSLYVLALGGPRFFGPVTPLGGLSLMVGWICLLIAAMKMR